MGLSVLVTGANGFIGSHVVDHLLETGHRVRCLVRPTSNLRWLPAERVELVHGEVTEVPTLPPAMEGVEVVYHVAGIMKADNLDGYLKVNATGARNVAEAARAAGSVRRGVLVSSLAAGGPSTPGTPRTEETPDTPLDLYGESKLRGETEFRDGLGDIPATIVRPPAVYGPRDTDFLVLANMVRRGWGFRISGDEQKLSSVYALDLARGIVALAQPEASAGRTYYLAHDKPMTWTGVARVMAASLGRSLHVAKVPRGALAPVSKVAGLAAGLVGRPNPVPWDRLKGLLAPAWECSADRARADIGFESATDFETGFRRTMDWYRNQGWIRE